MHVHVEYVHTLDPLEYERRGLNGLAPSRLPYALEKLEDEGWQVTVRPWNESRVLRLLDGVARRGSGGFELVEAMRDNSGRRRADVVACWDERVGVPAALRSRLPGEPPTALGVVWLTDSDAPIGRRGRALARRAFRRAGAVWAMSQPQLTVLQRDWGVDPSRLHMLHKGIDEAFWTPDATQQEATLVVGTGNDRHRDHPLLVEAMTLVQKEHPSLRFELVSHHAIQVPSTLGVRHPRLSHPEVRALYRRAAVIALALRPNLHVSGLSVVLEAMACARPVVTTRTKGIEAYVSDGETGLLVPPGDREAFAAAVNQLLADPDRATELGRAGREQVERRFSVGAQAARLSEILAAACS